MALAEVVAPVQDGRGEDFVGETMALVARESMEAEIGGHRLGEGGGSDETPVGASSRSCGG